ncbi:hypothetical protein ACHAWF_016501 [Thalassiosira exigua]
MSLDCHAPALNAALLPPGVSASSASLAAAAVAGGTVPEFLYQLTRMLTDDNRSVIEWSSHADRDSGRIEVHHPGRLEREVLGRYFRHSKYASFQRQLNYFGFRKIAGKGKMSPCSYVNEAATADIRSLLLMKRKGGKEKEAELARRREMADGGVGNVSAGKRRANPGDEIQPATVRPMFAASATAGLTASSAAACAVSVGSSQASSSAKSALGYASGGNKRARSRGSSDSLSTKSSSSDGRGYTVAVGKGIRHQLNGYLKPNAASVTSSAAEPSATSSAASSLLSKPTSAVAALKPNAAYLAHPSSGQASAVPAPLQFLDPQELGMSVEDSLTQLKDNFRSATASALSAPAPASSSASSAVHLTNSNGNNESAGDPGGVPSSSSSSAAGIQYAPSALTRRVSSAAFLGSLLRRDDSLIDLAVLPVLDADGGGADAAAGPNEAGGDGSGMASGFFPREDSLMNLAAAVEAAEAGGGGGGGAMGAAASSDGDGGADDHFDFVDFPS